MQLFYGNNDFLFGVKNLIDLSQRANFDFLSSNTFYSESIELVFKPYEDVIKWRDYLFKIGIVKN